jgi:hypothetical protein
VRTPSLDLSAHAGHRLTVADIPAGGVAVVCESCEVVLHHTPAAPPADPLGPAAKLLDAVDWVDRSLRAEWEHSRRAAGPAAAGDDPYWRGYADGARSARELFYHHARGLLIDEAARQCPAPDLFAARATVEAAVLARRRRGGDGGVR